MARTTEKIRNACAKSERPIENASVLGPDLKFGGLLMGGDDVASEVERLG